MEECQAIAPSLSCSGSRTLTKPSVCIPEIFNNVQAVFGMSDPSMVNNVISKHEDHHPLAMLQWDFAFTGVKGIMKIITEHRL